VYENNPRKYCEHVNFQSFFASIRVLAGASLDVDLKVDTDECRSTAALLKDIAGAAKDGKGGKSKDAKGVEDKRVSESVKDGKVSVDIGVNLKIADKGEKDDEASDKAKNGGFIGLNIPKGPRAGVFDIRELGKLGNLRNEYLCLLKEGKRPIIFVWRSPERMVRYLGDVVALQTFADGDRKGPVQILNEDGALVDLFRVGRGRDLLGGVAVSVEGPERESFYIPLPEPGSKTAHLSLPALALVMESFNLAVSGKALPQPATFFLSGG
jgi:hypothetical protein